MKAHIIVAFVAIVTILLFCAAVGPIDRGAEGVRWEDIKVSAQQQAKARLKSGEVWR